MARKIEWNTEHKNADEQEMSWRMEFVSWPIQKKWNYIMKLCKKPKKDINHFSQRRIEWI